MLDSSQRSCRHPKGRSNLWLIYKKSLDYKLVGFGDADYDGDRIERKYTSGICIFIGENLISSASKRQATISLSHSGLIEQRKSHSWLIEQMKSHSRLIEQRKSYSILIEKMKSLVGFLE